MNLQQQILDGYDELVIFSMDTAYRIMTINKSGQKLLKEMYRQEAKKGDCMLDFFESGPSKSLAKEHFDRALNGEKFTVTRPIESEKPIKYYNIMYAPLLEGKDIIGFSALVVDITLSRQNEEQKLLNETKFRNIFEGVSEGILVAGYHKGSFLYANPAILDLMGYEEKEVVNLFPKVVHDEKDHAYVLGTIKSCKHDKKSKTIEVDFIRKDGSRFLGLATYSVMKWADIDCVVAFIKDISKLKKAELAILDNEIKYQALFEHSHDAIIILNSEGKFITGNNAVVKLFNAENLEICQNTPPHRVWPEYQPDGNKSIDKAKVVMDLALKNGSHSFEWEYKKYTGEPFYASVALSRIDTLNEVLFQSSIRDISFQKETEETFKAQDELKKLLMNISSTYINVPLKAVNTTIQSSLVEIGEFVLADRAYIFDFDPNTETVSNTFEWCAADIKPMMDNTQNIPIDDIYELTKGNRVGEILYIPDTSIMSPGPSKDLMVQQEIKSLLTVPMMDGKSFKGFVGFDSVKNFHSYSEKDISLLRLYSDMLVNVTLRSEKQKELEFLLETTSSQNVRLKEFSYITSHNIRASVANLLGISDMLNQSPNNEEYLKMLNVTSLKLDNTIQSISELINFENEVGTLQKSPCNLSEAVHRVLKLTNHIILEKQAEFKVVIDQEIEISGHAAYLDSILHNIITNAIKYGITATSKQVDISHHKTNKGICLTIQDFGLGINLKTHGEKLFHVGTRLHDVSDGQGLGLFMTKRQIESMGGYIEVESQVGIGTTFKLFFQN